MAAPRHPKTRRGSAILVCLLAFFPSASAQTEFCGDLDGDGFVAGPGCAVQEDCNDQSPEVRPGAAELCNGRDDNCDGESDEGCDRTCPSFETSWQRVVNLFAMDPRVAAAERGWALVFEDQQTGGQGEPHVATRLDERGEPLAPQTIYAPGFPERPELVWTGRSMAASWGGGKMVKFRTLGAWGVPPGPVIEVAPSESANKDVVWNGHEYALLWTDFEGNQQLDGVRFARYSPSGELRGSVYLGTHPARYTRIAWNGGGYGWIYDQTSAATGRVEMYFRKVSPLGVLLGTESQVTDHTGTPPGTNATREFRIAHVGPGQGYGVSWQDDRTGYRQAWFARIDEDGGLVVPPGEVQVSAETSHIAQWTDLAWTGEEFLLAFSDNGARLKAARISREGAVLELKAVIPGFGDYQPSLAWNGRSFGLAFRGAQMQAAQPQVELAEVGCHCATDGDSDGVLPCAGGDCDDDDPQVALGTAEVCTDAKDNDCDGLVDCNDPDCVQGGNAPGAIAGLTIDPDRATLTWQADPQASEYDVARGVLSDLRDMENFRWADCLASRIAGTTWIDAQIPASGEVFYYTARGRAQTCVLGTWGSTLRNDTLRGCP